MTKQSCFLESDDYCILYDVGLWQTNIQTSNYSGPRAKFFSTMLSSCHFFLYDHPELIKKYPNGFYSENTGFVPVTIYERMKECEVLALKNNNINAYWNLTGLIFIPILINMMEQKYGVAFSDNEKNTVLHSSLEHVFYPNCFINGVNNIDYFKYQVENEEGKREMKEYKEYEYCSSINKDTINQSMNEIWNYHKPTFLPHKNLIQLTDELEMSPGVISFIKNLTDDTGFIDYALLKSRDIYSKGNPLNKIINKISYPINTIDLLNLDNISFKELINKTTGTKSYVLYNAFENLSYNIVKQSKDEKDLLRNISGVWTNFALNTMDTQFECLVNILYEQCVQKFNVEGKSYLPAKLLKKIVAAVNDHIDCSITKRRIVIDTVTRYSESISTVRSYMYLANEVKNKM